MREHFPKQGTEITMIERWINWILLNIKNSVHQKVPLETERKALGWKGIFTLYKSNKVLISRMYEEIINISKSKQPIKMSQTLEQTFHKRQHQTGESSHQ